MSVRTFSALDRGLTKKVEESQQHREIQLVITFQGETPLAIQKLNSGRRRTIFCRRSLRPFSENSAKIKCKFRIDRIGIS